MQKFKVKCFLRRKKWNRKKETKGTDKCGRKINHTQGEKEEVKKHDVHVPHGMTKQRTNRVFNRKIQRS